MTQTKKLSLPLNILFHFLPGIVVTAVYLLLVALIPSAAVPKVLLFYIAAIFMLPVMLPVMKAYLPAGKIRDVIGFREKLPMRKLLLLSLASFVWAVVVMMFASPVNQYLLDNCFAFMKPTFVITDYVLHPEHYSRAMLITTWVVGLVTTSTVLPFVEELYFRGFLLHSMKNLGIGSVFLGAFLFAAYHLFSIWMAPVRFVALLPILYIVYRTKDLRIGIIAHIALNVVGDSVLSFPILFGM